MKKILLETSARHIHITEEHFHILFGKDAKLEVRAPLSQPGEFVSTSRLDVVGPKRTIPNVSILGPFRKATQVEVSMTDARTWDSIVIERSGSIVGSAPIRLAVQLTFQVASLLKTCSLQGALFVCNGVVSLS